MARRLSFYYDRDESGQLTSSDPAALAYLTLTYFTQGKIQLAEKAFEQLKAHNTLTKQTHIILERLHALATLSTSRRALFLQLKIAAFCEDKPEKTGDKNWEFAELGALQLAMDRYLEVRHKLIKNPITKDEELILLRGIAKRMQPMLESALGKVIDDIADSKFYFGFVRNIIKSEGKKAAFYALSNLGMLPALANRLVELENSNSR